MTANPMKAEIPEPAASPSKPSVRLMAFVHAAIKKFTQIMNKIIPKTFPAKARLMEESAIHEMEVLPTLTGAFLGKSRESTA